MTNRFLEMAACDDSELVSRSLAGNREAFGQIVGRYQSLVCSIAYSATGSLTQSEDLAQETFVTAWTKLRDLREPGKIRAWLCGIARNLVNNALRRQEREPTSEAEPIEFLAGSPTGEAAPSDEAVSREEASILWRSLERIPETYREPLILFYREHRSIESVAAALDLTEDAVKQRLSRGRKLLHEEVTAFVEGALERTAPSQAFTSGVMAMLPIAMASSQAAAIGSAAAKGGVAAKAGATATMFLGAFAGPALGLLSGYLNYRGWLASARSRDERSFVNRYSARLWICIAAFWLCFVPLMIWSRQIIDFSPALFAGSICFLALAYAIGAFLLMRWGRHEGRRIFAGTAVAVGEIDDAPGFEYCSRLRLFGLPLVHIRKGCRWTSQPRPVVAWIAAGRHAYGLLCAFGGVAVAPISVGGLSIGILTFGGAGFGLLAMGGLAVGLWAWGGQAIGWYAMGMSALGWKAAAGWVAVAHDYAGGWVAHALHANSHQSYAFMRSRPFFRITDTRYFALWNLVWFVPCGILNYLGLSRKKLAV